MPERQLRGPEAGRRMWVRHSLQYRLLLLVNLCVEYLRRESHA